MSETYVQPAPAPEPVVMIIADISGYTRYMTANAKTLAHSQIIITELIKVIVEQIELPLKVAKLEGDAVFLFGRKGRDPQLWARVSERLGQKLLAFFEVFRRKVQELSSSTTCTCNACSHIEKLNLKLVVHSGEALFHRVLDFEELAGVDVIIIHRLLKNSVRTNQYLLLTESALDDVKLLPGTALVPGVEAYDDIGRIPVRIFYPNANRETLSATASPESTRFGRRLRSAGGLFLKLWFKPIQSWSRVDQPRFNHLESQAGSGQQRAFAMLTAVLTPVFVPIGMVLVLLQVIRATASPPKAVVSIPHVHLPDGSCCDNDQPRT